MLTVYFTKAWGIYNAHEQATLTDAEAQPLLAHGIAHPAASPAATAAREVSRRAQHRQGQPPAPPHRTIRTNASRADVEAWLKG
jgi:hypothetical protein